MSNFKSNENFQEHSVNMNYTTIQNMKAEAMDNDDWVAYDEAVKIEEEWVKNQ